MSNVCCMSDVCCLAYVCCMSDECLVGMTVSGLFNIVGKHNDDPELGLLKSADKRGEAGLVTGEASLTLDYLVRNPWEEGSGHAWLLPYSRLTSVDGARIAFGRSWASALVTISPSPVAIGLLFTWLK